MVLIAHMQQEYGQIYNHPIFISKIPIKQYNDQQYIIIIIVNITDILSMTDRISGRKTYLDNIQMLTPKGMGHHTLSILIYRMHYLL